VPNRCLHDKPNTVASTVVKKVVNKTAICSLAYTVVCALAASLFLANAASLSAAEHLANPFPEIYNATCPAIVNIQGDKVDEMKSFKTYKGMGTGIVIDSRGFVLTNNHVIAEIRKIQVTTHDKSAYTAILVARDLESDLAIIKINPTTPLPTIKIGRSDTVRPCDDVLAIGNPYGYSYSPTRGTVSGVGRDVEVDDTLLYRNAIQIDASINPGNSGGPLMNVDGEMIGINAAIRQGAQNIAFAIPSDQVIEIAAKMIADYTQKVAYHGIGVAEVLADDTPHRVQVVVTEVEKGSPAESCGLKKGDRLVSVGGKAVERELDFQCAMIRKPNDELQVTYLRDGDGMSGELQNGFYGEQSTAVTLEQPRIKRETILPRTTASTTTTIANPSPKVANQADPTQTQDKPQTSKQQRKTDPIWDTLGIRVDEVPLEKYQRLYATYLPLYPNGGVSVTTMKPDGIFAAKGVKVGDVIVGVQDWAITSPGNLLYLVNHWSENGKNDSVRIWVLRGDEHFYQDFPADIK
jgi:serine protease Do